MKRYKYTTIVFCIVVVALVVIAARQGAWP